MKRFKLQKNKLLRLLINIVLIIGWFFIYVLIINALIFNDTWVRFTSRLVIGGIHVPRLIICFLPMFFITRYIWFKKL